MRFPTKVEVATENQRRMNQLTGATRTYKSHDTPGVDDRGERVRMKVAIALLNKEIALEILRLKVRDLLVYGAIQSHSPQVGCQVMLIKVGYSLGLSTLYILMRGDFRTSSKDSWSMGPSAKSLAS